MGAGSASRPSVGKSRRTLFIGEGIGSNAGIAMRSAVLEEIGPENAGIAFLDITPEGIFSNAGMSEVLTLEEIGSNAGMDEVLTPEEIGSNVGIAFEEIGLAVEEIGSNAGIAFEEIDLAFEEIGSNAGLAFEETGSNAGIAFEEIFSNAGMDGRVDASAPALIGTNVGIVLREGVRNSNADAPARAGLIRAVLEIGSNPGMSLLIATERSNTGRRLPPVFSSTGKFPRAVEFLGESLKSIRFTSLDLASILRELGAPSRNFGYKSLRASSESSADAVSLAMGEQSAKKNFDA